MRTREKSHEIEENKEGMIPFRFGLNFLRAADIILADESRKGVGSCNIMAHWDRRAGKWKL